MKPSQIRLTLGLVLIAVALSVGLSNFFEHEFQAKETLTASDSLDDDQVVRIEEELPPGPKMESLEIERGDTLTTVIRRAFISATQTHSAIEAIKKVFNPRDLRTNHKIYITYDEIDGDTTNRDLLKLRIRLSIDQEVLVERTEEGAFISEMLHKTLVKEVRRVAGKIEESLYLEATKQGAHPQVLSQMLNAYAYDVDFQRSFQKGDEYCMLFEYYKDPETLEERPGNLLFACLTLRGKPIKIYRFKPSNGEVQYFNEIGESVKRGLLTTPIDGARISSGFGLRKHPILGFNKMHKGVDFAAPRNTPIMAAGDGTVVKIGRWGSYGNYIRIRHNNKYSTAYAHMCRYARGLKKGSRVRQGQTIGYVGATGRAAGCHLHYELLQNGKQVNPKHIKSLPAGKLNRRDMPNYKAHMVQINAQNEKLMNLDSGVERIQEEDLEEIQTPQKAQETPRSGPATPAKDPKLPELLTAAGDE